MILSLGLVACGDSGSSSTTETITLPTTGFSVPTEISAVPTTSSGSSKAGFRASISSFAATDEGTDYSKAETRKFVEENALAQFEIVEEIMSALVQTHYADEANINNGPYKAMIAWQDEENGVSTRKLEPWVVDSAMIDEDGQSVNRVRAWIEEVGDDGSLEVIKAEFKITASATKNTDGSYADYGVWTLNVKFGDSLTDFFVGEASVGENGESILKIHERFPEGPNFVYEVKAILNKTDSVGHGKVMFPSWDSCESEDCVPTTVTAKYAYNASHLAVQKEGQDIQYKDRSVVTDMTHRYGLYDSETGADVTKTKSFGFPITYTEDGIKRWGYYGAWQGRHQIWGDRETVPAGTTVTREDHGSDTAAETYTVSEAFSGTLTKRNLSSAVINDILNIPVETWININKNLRWDGTQWQECINPDFMTDPPTCGAGSGAFTDFASLVFDPTNGFKWVSIDGWDSGLNQPLRYVYDLNGPSGAGFYVGSQDQSTGIVTSTGTLYTPSTDDELWVNIGGSIYIEYTGTGSTGWVEKALSSFDQRTWTPVFDPTGDTDYTLPLNREYYINTRGANYVVKRTGTDVYDVKIELQSVANPVNATSFVASGTVFKQQWEDTGNSTFEFITDSSSAKFLKLVYKTVGNNDSGLDVSVGDIVTQGQWGLVAYVSDVNTGVQFNWDAPSESDDWGRLTYLINADGSYKILEDPIQLAPVTLTNNAGVEKTLSMQYDGWMHGLPDLYEELRKNDWVMSSTISDKIVNIPAGTSVVDAVDSSKSYLIKPLEISQFLNLLASAPEGLDITVADGVDLATIPAFVDHGMGEMPVVTTTKYSEGVLL